MVLNNEVLPAPLGPITAVIEPGCTSKPTPLSAFTPPKASVSASTRSTGAAALPSAGEVARGRSVSACMASSRVLCPGF